MRNRLSTQTAAITPFWHFLLSVIIAFWLYSCGGSEAVNEPSAPVESPAPATPDTLAAASEKPDSNQVAKSPPPSVADSSSLDFVTSTTDERINPVYKAKYNLINDGGYQLKQKLSDSLGCAFSVASEWENNRRDFQNLTNYFINGKISVIFSVAYATFDSVNIWAQVQEAITFGKNQLPLSDWRFDTTTERKMNATQTYMGRYNFNNRQYNMAFYRYKEYQFNVIVDHPIGSLTEKETEAINYLFATFVCGDPHPKLSIPKPKMMGQAALDDNPQQKGKSSSQKAPARKTPAKSNAKK